MVKSPREAVSMADIIDWLRALKKCGSFNGVDYGRARKVIGKKSKQESYSECSGYTQYYSEPVGGGIQGLRGCRYIQ